jgi:hypothetical protein
MEIFEILGQNFLKNFKLTTAKFKSLKILILIRGIFTIIDSFLLYSGLEWTHTDIRPNYVRFKYFKTNQMSFNKIFFSIIQDRNASCDTNDDDLDPCNINIINLYQNSNFKSIIRFYSKEFLRSFSS